MRKSRMMRSSGIGASPRDAQRVGRLVAAAAADLQRVVDDAPAGSEFHSLAIAASSRMSDLPRSASSAPQIGDRLHRVGVGRHGRRSSARPLRAGRPAGPTARARWPSARADLEAPLAARPRPSGSVRRPVLSVMSASFSPLPSPQSRFSFGTRTFVKRMTPFSIASQAHELAAMRDLDAGPAASRR